MAGYYIKRNHSTQLPRFVITFDTETRLDEKVSTETKQRHRLRLGVANYFRYRDGKATSRTQHVFRNAKEFWPFILSATGPRHTTWVIAHNLIFDLVMVDFTSLFESGEIVLDKPRAIRSRCGTINRKIYGNGICVIDDPPSIIGIRHVKTGARIIMVDSLNWFRCSLAEIGQSVGLAKGKMPEQSEPDEKWLTYCARDVEILERAMLRYIQFADKHDLGVFKWTAAGQAFAAFRHRFMTHKILLDDDFERKEFERKSYFGGRNDCFKLGTITEKVYHLDVNSLFPSVMFGNRYPTKPFYIDLNRQWSDNAPSFNPAESIAEVELYVSDSIYPKRSDKNVCYPKGVYQTVLAGPELEYAITQGHVQRLRNFVQYEMAPIFDDYVAYFWSLRKEYKAAGNVVYDDLCKLLLNSLYGKFAQRSYSWREVPGQVAPESFIKWFQMNAQTREMVIRRSIGYDVQEQCDRGEKKDSFPAISSFVTSNARLTMHSLMEIAGRSNVFYLGVDCVIVNQAGFDGLQNACRVHQSNLGKLKILGTADGCVIRGCGDYTFSGKDRRQGVKRSAVWINANTFRQTEFTGAPNLFKYRSLDFVETTEVTKTYASDYRRGKVDDNGNVKPFHLPDDAPLLEKMSKSSTAKA